MISLIKVNKYLFNYKYIINIDFYLDKYIKLKMIFYYEYDDYLLNKYIFVCLL